MTEQEQIDDYLRRVPNPVSKNAPPLKTGINERMSEKNNEKEDDITHDDEG